MDFLRDNPIPTLLITIAAVAGAVILLIAAIRGEPDAGGLTFQDYFQTCIVGGVGLAGARALKDGLAATRNDRV